MVKDESNQILRTLRLQLTLGGCSREGSNTSYRDKDKRDGGWCELHFDYLNGGYCCCWWSKRWWIGSLGYRVNQCHGIVHSLIHPPPSNYFSRLCVKVGPADGCSMTYYYLWMTQPIHIMYNATRLGTRRIDEIVSCLMLTAHDSLLNHHQHHKIPWKYRPWRPSAFCLPLWWPRRPPLLLISLESTLRPVGMWLNKRENLS